MGNECSIRKKKLKADMIMGNTAEIELKGVIEEFLDCKLKKTLDFDFIDYVSKDNNILIEIKSRRCNYNQYNSTMISKSKIDKGLEKMKYGDIRFFLFFKFTDGTYYYEVKQDIYNNVNVAIGGRTDRGYYEANDYVYIDIDKLNKLKI